MHPLEYVRAGRTSKTPLSIAERGFLRCLAESNCCSRFCRPVPNRSAKAPFCLRTAKISINFLTCKNYFRMSAIMSRASRQSLVITDQSLAATASFGKRLLPIPTQVTPALNQPSRFSRVGFTPPVTIILLHGIGARRPFTKAGPSTSPGKTLQRSQPSS